MRMRVTKADMAHGEGLFSLLKRLFVGRNGDEAMTGWYSAGIDRAADWPVAPPVRPVAAAMDDVQSARIALSVFDALADLSGADAAVLAARINGLPDMAVSAVQVQMVLERLFDQGQLAAYGPIFCLPEQVSVLRKQWLLRATLATLAMPAGRQDEAAARREAQAVSRISQWTGWNMPIARGLTH